MDYIPGVTRNQVMLFPETVEDYITENYPVRFIDAFVASLNPFHEYAAQSIQDSFWARAFYHSQRLKGKDHHAAVRALAFKWIRIIWKCWHTRNALQ